MKPAGLLVSQGAWPPRGAEWARVRTEPRPGYPVGSSGVRMSWRRRLVAVLLAAGVAAPAAAAERVGIAPAPPWADRLAADYAWRAQPELVTDGLSFLLVDRQWRVGERGSEDHFRFVERVETEDGLARASQLTVDWDPAHQVLTFHEIAVHRGGERRNQLGPERIEALRRETNLENQVYDGSLTAVVEVDDLRIGDVLEYAYTIRGSNPVYGGVHSRWFSASWSTPVHHARCRVLWPASRFVAVRASPDAPPVRERTLGNEIERVWQQRDVPAVLGEDRTPPDFDPFARIQISEDRSWAEVARWGAGLYNLSAPTRGELAERIASIRDTADDDGSRIAAALAVAQREVRYVGIEMGERSHRPAKAELVYQRRFGDCKDKAQLLVTMLRALGVHAWPAFVNTTEGAALDGWLPTRSAFNHVIVAVSHAGRTLWLDPTLAGQAGDPLGFAPPPLRRALVIRDGESALTTIELPPLEATATAVDERWSLEEREPAASLDVVTIHRGAAADDMRRTLATTSREQLSRRWLNYYTASFPSVEERAGFEVTDDPRENVLKVTEHYRVAAAWDSPDGISETLVFRAGTVLEAIGFPTVLQRRHPLSVPYPINVEHRMSITLPAGFQVLPAQQSVERPELTFSSSVITKGDRLELRYALRTSADRVAPADVAAYVDAVGRVHDGAQFTLTRPRTGSSAASMNWPVASMALLVFGALAFAAVRYYRAPRAPPLPAPNPGGPTGMGGWLLLLAFGVLVSPVRLTYDLITLVPSYALENWTHRTVPTSPGYAAGAAPLFIVELILNLGLLVLSVLLAVVMFARRRDFPGLLIAFAALGVVVQVCDAIAVAAVFPGQSGAAADLPRTVIWGCIWGLYVTKSVRVRNTFTR